MPRSLYVLSPCGTSLLTNQATAAERKFITDNANAKTADSLPAEDRAALTALIQRVEATMETAENDAAKKMSAELNGVIAIYSKDLTAASSRDYHTLLCTDT